MAKLNALPAQDIISGFKGTIDYYVWCGIPCARSWPRPPVAARSPAVRQQWPIFAIAANVWTNTDPYVREKLETQASPTTMSARDLAAKLYLNATPIYPSLDDTPFH